MPITYYSGSNPIYKYTDEDLKNLNITLPTVEEGKNMGCPTLLNETEVAEMLNISVNTLKKHRCTKRGLPYVKIERRVRYDLADINRYLSDNTILPERQ